MYWDNRAIVEHLEGFLLVTSTSVCDNSYNNMSFGSTGSTEFGTEFGGVLGGVPTP
ncbi:hypothetical protein RUM43_008755, partial [Polyplax serrata]